MTINEVSNLMIGSTLLIKYTNSWVENRIYEVELLNKSKNNKAIKIKILETNTEKWVDITPSLLLVDVF